jgi:hypothetical protein
VRDAPIRREKQNLARQQRRNEIVDVKRELDDNNNVESGIISDEEQQSETETLRPQPECKQVAVVDAIATSTPQSANNQFEQAHIPDNVITAILSNLPDIDDDKTVDGLSDHIEDDTTSVAVHIQQQREQANKQPSDGCPTIRDPSGHEMLKHGYHLLRTDVN